MIISDLPAPGAWAAPTATETPPGRAAKAQGGHDFKPFGDDGFTFFDVLDVINPLQHIPVVSTLYRELTGDDLAPFSRLAGGTLFGGPFGLAGAIVNMAVEDTTGKDIGGNVLAMFTGDSPDSAPPEADFATAAGGDAPAWAAPTAAEDAILAEEARVAVVAGEWAAPTAAEDAILAEEARIFAQGSAAPAAPAEARPEARPVARREPPAAPGAWMAFNQAASSSAAAVPDTAMAAQAVQDAQEAGSDIRALEAQAALDSMAGGTRPKPRPAPSGATSADGGWFTDAMLTALENYRKSSTLLGDDAATTAR